MLVFTFMHITIVIIIILNITIIVIIGSIYYGLFASDSNAIPYDDFGSNAPAKSWEVSE